jgi:hypothetical protein
VKHARPGLSIHLLAGRAAAQFGVALDEFHAKPAVRRAEMMAHVIIERQRENYEHDLLRRDEELAKKRAKLLATPSPTAHWMKKES